MQNMTEIFFSVLKRIDKAYSSEDCSACFLAEQASFCLKVWIAIAGGVCMPNTDFP